MSDEAEPSTPARDDGLVERPFPFALLALTAACGWAAIEAQALWLQASAIVGVLLCAAAAIYQSRPQRVVAETPAPDEDDPAAP